MSKLAGKSRVFIFLFCVFCRVRKILNLRIFDSDEGRRWDKSVIDKQYEILCVSQVKRDVS